MSIENPQTKMASALRDVLEATGPKNHQKEKCLALFQSVYELALKARSPEWDMPLHKRKPVHRLFSASSAVMTAALHRAPDLLSDIVKFLSTRRTTSRPPPDRTARRLCITATGGEREGFRTLYVTIGAGVICSYFRPTIVQGNYSVTGCGCGAFAESNIIQEANYRLERDGKFDRAELKARNFAYLHAPFHHAILDAFAEDRGILAFPDIFKLTTALTDPWRSPYQFFGIWDKSMAQSVGRAMAHIPHLKAGFVAASDTIDEFLNYGIYVSKKNVSKFSATLPAEFKKLTKESIISTSSVADELDLIKTAIKSGPTSDDIRHRLIWRNAALALAVCESPPADKLAATFQATQANLSKNHPQISEHATSLFDSWGE